MATDDIISAANKETQTRLNNISAVTGNVTKLRSEMDKKFRALQKNDKEITTLTNSSISKVNKDISFVKKGMAIHSNDIKSIASQKGVKEIQSSVSSMLASMSKSVGYLSQGVKKTTIESARATRDLVSQYGKAISEDISINKQNTIAMSMAKSSPLFGYFAAKFMETDVYSSFTDKIKSKFSEAANAITPLLTGMFRQGFEKIKDLRYMFSKKPKIEWSEESLRAMGDTKATVRGLGEKINKKQQERGKDKKRKIPHLAKGGVIKSSGLAKVHKGEVVMSIDELLKTIEGKIDKTSLASSTMSEKLSSGLSILTESQVGLEHYVGITKDKQKRGLVADFVESFKKSKNVGEQTWQDRLLKATLELKVALVGTTNRMQLAWQETLIKHPTFRNAISLAKTMKLAFDAPLRFLFSAKGGYLGEIKRATRNKNVFINIVSALSLMYAKWSNKFDTLIDIGNSQLEAMGGKRRKESKDETFTYWEKLKSWAKADKPKDDRPIGQKLFSFYSKHLGLDQKQLEDAGISSFSDLLSPGKVLARAGVTKSRMREKFDDEYKTAQAARQTGAEAAFKLHDAGVRAKQKAKPYAEAASEKFGEAKEAAAETARGAGAAASGMWSKLFGKKKPSLAPGGFMKKTGTILAHKGELIVPVKEVFAMIKSFADSSWQLVKAFEPLKEMKKLFKNLNNSIREIGPQVAKAAANAAKTTADTVKTETIKAYQKLKEAKPFTRLKETLLKAKLKAQEKIKEKFKQLYETTQRVKEGAKSKSPFKFSDKLKDTKVAEHMMGFFEKFLQKTHELSIKRSIARQRKYDEKRRKNEKDYITNIAKHKTKIRREEESREKASQKRWNSWWKRSNETRERTQENFDKHAKKMSTLRVEENVKGIRKIEKLKEWLSLRTIMKQTSIFRTGQRDVEKIKEKSLKKTLKYEKKHFKKLADREKQLDKKQQKKLTRMEKWQAFWERRQQNKQDAYEKMMDRLRLKEEKQVKKIQKMQNKIEAEELKYKMKLAAMEANMQTSAERKLAKEEAKLNFLQAKQKMKEMKEQKKIEAQFKKEQFAIRKKQIKAQMAEKRKEMKERTVQMKEEMKVKRAELKERVKKMKEEAKQKKKEMWSKRWNRILDFPKQFQEAQEKTTDRYKKRMQKLNEQIAQLSKIRKFTTYMGEKFPTFTKYIKKAWGGIGKWIMIGMGFIKNIFSRSFGKLFSILGGLLALLPKGLTALKGLTGLGGVGMAGAAAGIGGVAWGAKDAYDATKKSKKWGVHKAAAGAGGFLGGSTDRREGIMGALDVAKDTAKGVAKGGMIGAGIGTMVGGPVGTAIGAAVGAIAGGILGAVGGKNIAKGMQYVGDSIKRLALGVWDFIKIPFTFIWKAMKQAKEAISVVWDNMWIKYQEDGVTGVVKYLSSLTWWIVKKIGTSLWALNVKVTNAVNSFLQDTVFPKIRDAIFFFVDPIVGMFRWIGDKVTSIMDGIKNYIADKISSIPGVGSIFNLITGRKKKTIEEKALDAKQQKLNRFKPMMSEKAFAMLGGDPESFEQLVKSGRIVDTTTSPMERSLYKTIEEAKGNASIEEKNNEVLSKKQKYSAKLIPFQDTETKRQARESMRNGYVSADIARREAEREITRAKATAGPIIASQEKTRAELNQGNKAVVNNMIQNTNAISANTNAVSNSSNNSGGGGSSRSGDAYTLRVIEGDIL